MPKLKRGASGAQKLVTDAIMVEAMELRNREMERKRKYREREEREDRTLREMEMKRRERANTGKARGSQSEVYMAQAVTPPDPEKDNSLQALRKAYEVQATAHVQQYRKQRNSLITKYIDDVEVSR